MMLWVYRRDIELFVQTLRQLIETGEAHGGGTVRLVTSPPEPDEFGTATNRPGLIWFDELVLRWRPAPGAERDWASLVLSDSAVEVSTSSMRLERWIEAFESLSAMLDAPGEAPRGFVLVREDESTSGPLNIAETLEY